jgi:hypothetical protein
LIRIGAVSGSSILITIGIAISFTIISLVNSNVTPSVEAYLNKYYGFVTKWGGQGPADGQFNDPFGLAVDSTLGYVYVADTYNHPIQVFALKVLNPPSTTPLPINILNVFQICFDMIHYNN